MTRTPSHGAALELAAKSVVVMRIEATGQWRACADVRLGPRQGAALVVAVKSHNIIEVHHVLAHGSEEITQKMVQAMEVATKVQWGPCEARLQADAKQQAVKWIDGPGKTGSNGVGKEDLGVKLGGDESVGRRKAAA